MSSSRRRWCPLGSSTSWRATSWSRCDALCPCALCSLCLFSVPSHCPFSYVFLLSALSVLCPLCLPLGVICSCCLPFSSLLLLPARVVSCSLHLPLYSYLFPLPPPLVSLLAPLVLVLTSPDTLFVLLLRINSLQQT